MSAPIVERLNADADRWMAGDTGRDNEEAGLLSSEAADTITDLLAALEGLERWFDTDEEILSAMDADTLADHKRQHSKIRAAIAKAKGGAA